MSKRLSTREKFARKKMPKKVRLDYDFAGIKAGSLMFVGTPQIVDRYIRAIPFGNTRTIRAMRRQLARKRSCDDTCPVSTSFFIRTVAEAALEDIADGNALSAVTLFWRLISSEDKIAKRLPIDPKWLDQQREFERHSITESDPAP